MKLHANGEWADFDVDDWHPKLTAQNRGGTLTFTVSLEKDGQWTQYEEFKVTVSSDALDDYGLTYRRIPPGYEVGGDIGIFQRDIHCFEETDRANGTYPLMAAVSIAIRPTVTTPSCLHCRFAVKGVER